jgi:16S rRNA (cytosine967-C5)-methyltransferase
LLADENAEQISAFREKNRHFTVRPWRQVWAQQLASPPPQRSADGRDDTLLLSPATHGTDGFFVAVLERTS